MRHPASMLTALLSLWACGDGLPHDPSLPGPFQVGLLDRPSSMEETRPVYLPLPVDLPIQQELGEHDPRDWLATIYYPARSDGYGAPAATEEAPHQVVVFAHGGGASKNIYTWVGQHLASWGFVVLLFSVPRPDTESTRPWVDGIKAAIDRLEAENARPGPLQGLLDVRRVGVAGHSMGAMAALLAAAEDRRVGAVAAMAALKDPAPPTFTAEPFRPLAVPVQLLAGSRDGAAPPDQSQKHFEFHVGPRQLLVIGGANHIGFLDRGLIYEASRIAVELGLQPDGPATISRDDQERISRKYLTAWLKHHLKGEQAWAPYLDGELALQDLREGVLSRLEHRP